MHEVLSFFERPEYLFAAGCLFLGIGIAFSISPMRTLIEARKVKSWPQVDGIVTKSEIVSEKDDEGTDMYSFGFEYEYRIGDERYRSRGRFLDDEFKRSWKGKLNEISNEYPVGKKTKVFYNQSDFHQSTVVNSVPLRYYLPLLITAIFCVVGVWTIIQGINM